MDNELKSIQKYPELADCKNLSEYMGRLQELHPPLPKGATAEQKQRLFEGLVKGVLDSPFHTEEQKQNTRNLTWEVNHNKLMQAMHQLIQKRKVMPSINDLVNETGLTRQTIRKHLTEFQLSLGYSDDLQKFRMLSNQVVTNLFELAMDGNVKAAKIYLDAVGGLLGIQQPTKANQQTNYIQVNNNLKIDQITFMSLPDPIQQQISELIQQGLQFSLIPVAEVSSIDQEQL